MAYNELIKNFKNIRDYMREFYVYGFKSRDQYNKKSARSYDNERRRLESWLGEYMHFQKTQDGKNVFISIDSRLVKHNPLYEAWKAKSFTEGDITLHFMLMDILSSSERIKTLMEIVDEIDNKQSAFEDMKNFDESTIRKKLNEYISEGIVVCEKKGKTLYYKRAEDVEINGMDYLDFFSEVAPCGVVGSYLLDKEEEHKKVFAFKHHYITSAIDSEILYLLFDAMRKKCNIAIKTINKKGKVTECNVVPLRIFISVQGGRQYLMAYEPESNTIIPYRIDYIVSVDINESSNETVNINLYRQKLNDMLSNMWGVNTRNSAGEELEHIEFTIKYEEGEEYIHKRLEREKRCGYVEEIDKNTLRFSADVFNSEELFPWIRTFICRIVNIKFSNKELEKQFKGDMELMYKLYDLGVQNNELF